MKEQEKFIIQAYNSRQLAAYYNIGYDAWLTWLKPHREKIGKQFGRVWQPAQVEMMVNIFGPPRKDFE